MSAELTTPSGRSANRVWTAAGVAGVSGVVLGAFAAHYLPNLLTIEDPDRLSRRLAQFDTATRYHLIHAVALAAIAGTSTTSAPLRRAAVWLAIGIALFSGSLYLLVLTDTPWLGAVTPLGGLSWIVGWVYVLAAGRATSNPTV